MTVFTQAMLQNTRLWSDEQVQRKTWGQITCLIDQTVVISASEIELIFHSKQLTMRQDFVDKVVTDNYILP